MPNIQFVTIAEVIHSRLWMAQTSVVCFLFLHYSSEFEVECSHLIDTLHTYGEGNNCLIVCRECVRKRIDFRFWRL